MHDITSSLENIFKGDIKSDNATLTTYSHDASLFEVKPEYVLFPKDVSDIKNLISFINNQKQQGNRFFITARAAGTDMTGGSLGESIILDMTKYFSHVKDVGEGYAITEPGVYYRDFDKETLKINQILPSYTASRDLCTVGGMVANNSGGEKTLVYGKTEDYILELKMVASDGNEYTFKPLNMAELDQKKKLDTFEGQLYRKMFSLLDENYDVIKKAKPNVSKNSSGYYLWNVYDREKGIFDLTRVIVGSQGTFGIITEIKFKLIKPKTHSRLLVIFLKDMKQLALITNKLLTFKPESLESYDDHTFRLAVKLFPEMIKRLKGNVITLAFRFLPEFWKVFTGGIPKLVLMAEFTGDSDEEAHIKAVEAQKGLDQFHVESRLTQSEGEIGKYWVIRRESFNMLRHHIKKLRTAPFIDDLVVRPEFLPEFLPRLYAILDQYKDITYTIAGHVGDGNFHIIPLMDFTKSTTKDEIFDIGKKVYDLIFEFKGTMSGEHNDGIFRTPFLVEMYGTEVEKLFQKTKEIFDPNTIFNPGKKVGGNVDYARAHIVSS